MLLLLAFLITAGNTLILKHRQNMLEEAKTSIQGELELLGLLVGESLRRRDYQTVGRFLSRWGLEHQDIEAIRATAANGFILANYLRDRPADHAFTATVEFKYPYAGTLKLELAVDLTPIYRQTWLLIFQLVSGSILFIVILGYLLWITQRIAHGKQTRLHQTQLAHAGRLNLMGEMASGIAHELNQPLTAMVTYTQASLRILESGRSTSKELKKAMQQVATQGLRAGEVIQRMKQFARKGETRRSVTDINTLVQNAVGLTDPEVKEKGVRILLQLTEPLPRIRVDTIHIEQVILNLLNNGIQAITGSGDTSGKLTISTSETGKKDEIQVCVHDTGPGMKDNTEQIFEPFFTTKPDGTGMGLAISRSLLEAHGGRLWTEPATAGGATFCFSLPVHAGA